MANRRVSLKGRGADLFFGDYPSEGGEAPPAPDQAMRDPAETMGVVGGTSSVSRPAAPQRKRANSPEGVHASVHASKHASETNQQTDRVETIRKVVKRPGKEVVYVRLTPEEKRLLADVVHQYRRRGLRTSDNELGRIAINSLLGDYQEHGEESLLARVLAALES